MPLPRIIEYALKSQEPLLPVQRDGRLPTPVLSRREREVTAMLGRGMSNREIAVSLVISERTAESHVEHIRNKLQVASRGQAAVWAAQQGMIPPPLASSSFRS